MKEVLSKPKKWRIGFFSYHTTSLPLPLCTKRPILYFKSNSFGNNRCQNQIITFSIIFHKNNPNTYTKPTTIQRGISFLYLFSLFDLMYKLSHYVLTPELVQLMSHTQICFQKKILTFLRIVMYIYNISITFCCYVYQIMNADLLLSILQ
jgi:hypothetical protein